jgi:protein-tyrosine phosphatase
MPCPTVVAVLTGAPNFRDLGGLPTLDGRSTRRGVIYRSDSLHALTDDDVSLVRGLGLATVIDLQSSAEAARVGRGPLAADLIGYVNVSVSQSNLERPVTTTLAERYLSYLDDSGPAFARALGLLADPGTYPAVFHCFFGKDRTGVLAALLLDLVGVERAAIAGDFAASGAGMALIIERLSVDPVYAETFARTPPFLLAAPAEAMDEFFARLNKAFGGTREWALQAGLAAGELDALPDLLLQS